MDLQAAVSAMQAAKRRPQGRRNVEPAVGPCKWIGTRCVANSRKGDGL